MPYLIEGKSISDAWEKSLTIFLNDDHLVQYTSQRGACHEASNVLLSAPCGGDLEEISSMYPKLYQSLVETYANGFIDDLSNSTVSNRLFKWPSRDGSMPINQFDRLLKQIEEQPNSRSNIIGFWDPEIDPNLNAPVSPINCNLRIRHGKIDATLVTRTVDAWLGGFPMFIALSRLIENICLQTNLQSGVMSILMYSYHVYDIDLPIVRATAKNRS